MARAHGFGGCIVVGLALMALASCPLRAEEPKWLLAPADLTFAPAGSDDVAASLVAKMLQVNRPWLEPGEARGSYSLRRATTKGAETTGPFAVKKGSPIVDRVGSIVLTPLHRLAMKTAPYTIRMVGKARWNDLDLIAVDVTFSLDVDVRNAVGMGGQRTAQGTTTYASCSYSVRKARIVIEQSKGIPVRIESTDGADKPVTWRLDPRFLEVAGGLAPRMLEWNDPRFFREEQQFQIVDGLWLFKRGDSWTGDSSDYGKPGAQGVTIEMVDVELHRG